MPTDFNSSTTTWTVTSGNSLLMTTTIGVNDTIAIPFKATNRRKISIASSANAVPWTGCAVTMAEFTLGDTRM